MFIQQIYTGCLAQASYYIESRGEAAVIDPIRDTEPYTELAKERHAKIRYIFETHFHADFVSGHLDLAQLEGASIVFGPGAKPSYTAYIASGNEEFPLGDCIIKLLHTPGHTMESSCLLLENEEGRLHAVFTGDTLFVGDVGRPDLMSGNKSKYELASLLYDSIHQVINKLPDEVLVYPGHGAGSACGKNLGVEKHSTIGEQKRMNYALQPMSREAFIEAVTENLVAPPAYFFEDARINKIGYKSLKSVIGQNYNELPLSEFKTVVSEGALILDTRNAEIFSNGFIKGSVNIGLKGDFAPWVGSLLDIERPIVLISDPGTETEAIRRLARIGFEQVTGFLKGGFDVWRAANLPYEVIENLDAEDFCYFIDNNEYNPVDVRRFSEVKLEYIKQAANMPLEELSKYAGEFDKDKKYILFCKGGYRSMIAASLLKSAGVNNIINVPGGIEKIKQATPALIVVQEQTKNLKPAI